MNFLRPTDINQMSEIYKNYPGPYAIDEEDLERIFPGIQDVQTTEYGDWVQGNLPPHNLHFINMLAKYIEPKIVLEIGTYKGRTTYNLLMNSTSKTEVITIDPPNGGKNYDGSDLRYFQSKEQIGTFYKGKEGTERITQIYEDSMSLECLRELEYALRGRRIDLAFIDGGHTYENVKNDFEELVLPRLRRGGIVVFDDYNRLYTVVGITHYLAEKARKEGYVFYWYAPRSTPNTNEVIFINKSEARGYAWKSQ